MFKKLLLFSTLFFLTAHLSAQTSSVVTGNVKDTSSHTNVKNAVVALLTPKDSVLKGFTRVKEDGSWIIPGVQPGSYILSVTHPMFADFVDDITVRSAAENIPAIAVTPKSKLLEQVIVKSGNPIRLKGDTTIYTADSFKVSANANVEELLKKMPGIQVDKNGQIKAMGQTVEKVLVDGEEFFGDDPGMAVKNLRADAVKEVQVFDKKSEQSEFTGIDDGKTQKTINLKLKEDKKKGYFGKIDLAGGLKKNIDDRYNNNILLSSFKGKRKISGFLLNGNTGQDGLDWQDQQKYGGDNDNMTMSMDDDGNSMFMFRGGSSDDEPYIDPQNGFMTNINAGIQYSNKWNDKTTLNFSPKYNSQVYNNHKETFTQTQIGDSALNNDGSTQTHINRHNVKLRAIYDVKIDSANTIKITGNANFYHTESNEATSSMTSLSSGTFKNASYKLTNSNSDKDAYSGNIIFKHKFKKARRTLSVTADWNTQNNEGLSFLRSSNADFYFNTVTDIDQMKDYKRSTANVSSKFVYTEPLGKKYSLELAYQLSLNHGVNDQTTYRPSAGSPKYDVSIDSLSNRFRQNILQHIPSARLNYSYKKLKINVGAGVSLSDFNLKDLSLGKAYDRNYTNFYPSANLNYSYKSNHNLRFTYNGNTKQPTIDQLQPLRNNNDQFNQYIGNPGLKPSFSNNFNISHNGYNFLKDIWMYQSLNINLVSNSITNSRIINVNNGTSVTQPVNMNGNYNINFWGGMGFKLKKIDTRVNLNLNGGFNRYADLLNLQKSVSNSTNGGMELGFYKEKEKKYDLGISNNITYNVQKTSQNNNRLSYITNSMTAEATVYYKKVWSIESDYELFTRQKTSQVPGLTTNVMNAKLNRTFKKDEFTVYFGINDIFNQNTGLTRNFYQNTFTEVRNDRLQRYWMLGLRWDFKNKAAKKN